jgi:NAD(P)-dependent dehydrogenase (short-subunit alcohol dehydrogenase family)
MTTVCLPGVAVTRAPRTFGQVTWTAADLPDLSGRTAIVTGANSGIGLPTARALAEHGARVVLACRDPARGAQAADRIRRAVPAADLTVAEIDLARLDSVRAFAAAWAGPVHLLVNNAGVMAPPALRTTSDGFERQFGTNHLGHFVLTALLLRPLLAADQARVVTVASLAHFGGTAAVLEGNVGTGYSPKATYSNSKLANLLFAKELQRRAAARGLPLTSTAAHPGLSATGLVSDREGMGSNPVLRVTAPFLLPLVTQSATAGARATLYAATVAAPGSYTGPRWLGGSRGPIGPARQSACASDADLASRLWDVSEQLTGVSYDWP